MPNIVNFTSLDPGYFSISVNILELHSGVQFIYLETVWSFQGFLLKSLLCGTWAASSLGLVVGSFPTTKASPLGITYSIPHELWGFPHQLEGTGTISILEWVLRTICSAPFRWFFSYLREFPHCVLSALSWLSQETLWMFQSSLSYPVPSPTNQLPRPPWTPHSASWAPRQPGSAWVPAACSLEIPQVTRRGKRRAHLACLQSF